MEMDLWYDLYLRDLASEYVRRARPARKSAPPSASDEDDATSPASSWRRGLRHVLRGAA